MEQTVQPFRYDVFLSFRGADTRNNFTSHLYEALTRHEFEVFHDTTLSRGLGIAPQLLEAIKGSKVYVVVFSARYADSEWCLDELSQMVCCVRMNGKQTVLPVFLDVKQADFGTRDGPFEELIANHETRFDLETVQKWREALQEVGEVPGLHLQDDAHGDEYALVDQIVERIEKMLSEQRDLNIADLDRLVGMDSRVQEVISLLNAGSKDDDDDDDVRVVVICGPAGIGKTTIAKATFGRLAKHFKAQYSCFLADVKTTFREPNGKLALQKQLVSNLVQDDETRIRVDNYHQGIGKIQRLIRNEKLLLVVDDVDHEEQLKILGVNRAILGSGSRIIVTTRDEARVVGWARPDATDATYRPRLLDENESLKVFCLNAFGQDQPKKGYEDVSSEAVRWGAGSPGVVKDLVVYMGDFESVEEWGWALRYVKQNPSCIDISCRV